MEEPEEKLCESKEKFKQQKINKWQWQKPNNNNSKTKEQINTQERRGNVPDFVTWKILQELKELFH